MACGYWNAGVSDYEAAFHVTFRENPFGGEFTAACGLATVIDFLRALHFDETEIDYLASQHRHAADVLRVVPNRSGERLAGVVKTKIECGSEEQGRYHDPLTTTNG